MSGGTRQTRRTTIITDRPAPDPVGLGYLAGGDQARRNGMVAAAGQRFTSVFVLVGVAVIIAIVMLVI